MLRKLHGVILLALLASALPRVPAQADDALSIKGAYGDVEGKGCDSFKEETEGPYFVVDEDGRGYGSGGGCGCKVTSVKETGKDAYSFVAVTNASTAPTRKPRHPRCSF